jgi:RNA polymerase sigma-70 factor, ECF subfamily
VSMFAGPDHGLELLQGLAGELDGYAPFHLARADMFRRLGRADETREAYGQALDLTQNQPEREYISEQIQALGGFSAR